MKYFLLIALAFTLFSGCSDDSTSTPSTKSCDVVLEIFGTSSHFCQENPAITADMCTAMGALGTSTYSGACPAGWDLECVEDGTTIYYYDTEDGDTCADHADED